MVRVPQIRLGNIYEKCQGEAGGWRSPLPSSTWLSTPNSSLTSQTCEPVCVCGRSCECVREWCEVPCSRIKRHCKQKTRVAWAFSSTFQSVLGCWTRLNPLEGLYQRTQRSAVAKLYIRILNFHRISTVPTLVLKNTCRHHHRTGEICSEGYEGPTHKTVPPHSYTRKNNCVWLDIHTL